MVWSASRMVRREPAASDAIYTNAGLREGRNGVHRSRSRAGYNWLLRVHFRYFPGITF